MSGKFKVLAAIVLATAILALPVAAGRAAKPKKDRALQRTRKQVRMLDDIYKTVVVLVTEHYVTEESSLPAGAAAKALFAAIKEKGWHEVRLLDASGDPINDVNSPQDDFEKKAVAALQGGQAYYDQQIDRNGKRYLRAATPIPVVMQKCVMCHPNYADFKGDAPIGALSYTLPIE